MNSRLGFKYCQRGLSMSNRNHLFRFTPGGWRGLDVDFGNEYVAAYLYGVEKCDAIPFAGR